jgi:hypothetical protein
VNKILDRIAERTRQIRDERARATRERLEQLATKTSTGAGGFTAGARVFDTVSGQEAEVVHGARENILLPNS